MATALDPQSLARLPNVASATLPVTYERAKTALEKCADLDECKNWADKAEALASYAKQAGDHALRKMADRIQARAIRRCGELLKQVMPATGAHRKKGGASPLSRKTAARQAGLSPDQQKQALRVERVPAETFDALVESDTPPTVTKLAEMGTMKRVAESSKRPGFSQATTAIGTIRRFAEFCTKNDPVFVAGGVAQHESQELHANVAIIDKWMDRFITRVGEDA